MQNREDHIARAVSTPANFSFLPKKELHEQHLLHEVHSLLLKKADKGYKYFMKTKTRIPPSSSMTTCNVTVQSQICFFVGSFSSLNVFQFLDPKTILSVE